MKEIELSGIVGWDITSYSVENSLKEANGEDVLVKISSPGGSVFEGIDIYNKFREYTGKVTARITGVAASMASYIAMAADEVEVYDNSVFMIHNAWSLAIGDYKEMQKTANLLESLTGLLAKSYTKATGKKEEEVRGLMDEESWFYGEEIKENGFAAKVLEDTCEEGEDDKEEKDVVLNNAKISFEAMMVKVKKEESFEGDLNKAAAFFDKTRPENKIKMETVTEVKETAKMNKEELMAKYPDLYNSLINEGAEMERKRVKAHLKFIDACKEDVVENIKNGSSIKDEEVCAAYMMANIQMKKLDELRGEDAPELDTEVETEEKGKTEEKDEATEEDVDAFLKINVQ